MNNILHHNSFALGLTLDMTKITHGLLDKIRELVPTLNGQQKKAAVFILENYKTSAFLNSTQLAMKAEVSAATFNRLCTQLNFSGFAAFQKELRNVVQTELTSVDRAKEKNSAGDTLSSVLQAETSAMERAFEQLSRPAYDKAVELIAKQRRLFIVGHQACEPVAMYAAYTLSKVRAAVELLDISRLSSLGTFNSLDQKDVALVFGMPRYPVKTVETLQELKKRGVPVILVTHSELCPYTALADITLVMSIQYHQFTDGLSPLISLVNALAIDLYKLDEAEGKRRLEMFEDFAQYLFVQGK